MVELLPCSKCRRVPERGWLGPHVQCRRCGVHVDQCLHDTPEDVWARWNRLYGAPVTLAERPQDEPACEVQVEREADGRWLAEVPAKPGAMAYGTTAGEAVQAAMAIADDDEPAEGDGEYELDHTRIPGTRPVVARAAKAVRAWARCDGGPCGGCS